MDLDPVAPVPAGDLDFVEGSDVIYQAASQFVPPPEFSVAVQSRHRSTAATLIPCGEAVLKIVTGQFAASDLGVREPPALAVPVLDHPVVDPPSRLEVT